MQEHQTSWGPVVEKVEDKFGERFEPKRRTEYREGLIRLLVRELPQFEEEVVIRALDQSFRRFRIPIDWHRFICFLVTLMPGWWGKLSNNPGFDASTMLLLTDGTVMCQEQGGKRWRKLTPDASGSYVNGTWSDLAPMHWTRRYYASAVLADGRVLVSGGEYSDAGSETNKTEIYEPTTDIWTELTPPAGWTRIGDAACSVLPDGRVLLGNLDDTRTAIFDPATDTFSAGPAKAVSSSEESWVLLPDETVITVRCDSSRRADKYVAAANTWVDGGTLPTGIVEVTSSEIGAGVLLNDGRAFFAGANGHNALYTPPALASDPGTWTMGPGLPERRERPDGGLQGHPRLPAHQRQGADRGRAGQRRTRRLPFADLLLRVRRGRDAPGGDPPNAGGVPYIGRMLLLPTGQVLFAAQTGDIYAYNYLGCVDSAARPQITAAPATVRPFHGYTLHGRVLNGLSQAVGYGDDAAAATNYPLVRSAPPGQPHVSYCRTMTTPPWRVASGASIESTQFFVPWGTKTGPSELCVVANGISSPCCRIEVRRWLRWPWFDCAICGATDRQPSGWGSLGARAARADSCRSVGTALREAGSRGTQADPRWVQDTGEARQDRYVGAEAARGRHATCT